MVVVLTTCLASVGLRFRRGLSENLFTIYFNSSGVRILVSRHFWNAAFFRLLILVHNIMTSD